MSFWERDLERESSLVDSNSIENKDDDREQDKEGNRERENWQTSTELMCVVSSLEIIML